jgi:hypothetical protein
MDRQSTSAEPPPTWPVEALRICGRVVLADELAGKLAEVPLLTDKEARLVVFLLPVEKWGSQHRAFLYFLGLVVEWNRRAEGRAWFIERGEKFTREETKQAALRVERAVQEWLWFVGGPGSVIRDRQWAEKLWDAQSSSHRAVVAREGSRKTAKRLQVEASQGRQPLTLCLGRRMRRLPEDELRRTAPAYLQRFPDALVFGGGDGCFTIIPDSVEPRHPKKYCDRCAKRAGNTKNAGLTKTILKEPRRNWR